MAKKTRLLRANARKEKSGDPLVDRLLAKNQEQNEQINSLKSQIALMEDGAKLEKQVSQLAQMHENLKRENRNLESDNEMLMNTNSSLEQEARELRARCQELESQVLSLREQLQQQVAPAEVDENGLTWQEKHALLLAQMELLEKEVWHLRNPSSQIEF